jgi:hypothetical protein
MALEIEPVGVSINYTTANPPRLGTTIEEYEKRHDGLALVRTTCILSISHRYDW